MPDITTRVTLARLRHLVSLCARLFGDDILECFVCGEAAFPDIIHLYVRSRNRAREFLWVNHEVSRIPVPVVTIIRLKVEKLRQLVARFEGNIELEFEVRVMELAKRLEFTPCSHSKYLLCE